MFESVQTKRQHGSPLTLVFPHDNNASACVSSLGSSHLCLILTPLFPVSQVITVILELGIAFHSVVIGISLGAMGGDEFVALWIAMLFHQFFEGESLEYTLTLPH